MEANAERERRIIRLEDASIFIVFNTMDNDAQIFVKAESDEPIKVLNVRTSGRIKPVVLEIGDGDNLGVADVTFETPEPSIEELAKAYPEGRYIFFGRTVEGNRFFGEVNLRYELLEPPVITFPTDGMENISTSGLTAFWEPIDGAEAIRFEVEDEEEEVAFTADLSGDATMFNFPEGWLQSGVEYTMDVKAIGENGNQTVVDIRFTTAE